MGYQQLTLLKVLSAARVVMNNDAGWEDIIDGRQMSSETKRYNC